jgi:hypothetical protein
MRKSIFILFISGFLCVACQPEEASFTLYTLGDSTMANKKAAVNPETGAREVARMALKECVAQKLIPSRKIKGNN